MRLDEQHGKQGKANILPDRHIFGLEAHDEHALGWVCILRLDLHVPEDTEGAAVFHGDLSTRIPSNEMGAQRDEQEQGSHEAKNRVHMRLFPNRLMQGIERAFVKVVDRIH